jgi:hypothetical protein
MSKNSLYAIPNNPENDDKNLVTLVNKDRLEANDVTIAEGIGVVDDFVAVSSVDVSSIVLLSSSNSAMGALGIARSVG